MTEKEKRKISIPYLSGFFQISSIIMQLFVFFKEFIVTCNDCNATNVKECHKRKTLYLHAMYNAYKEISFQLKDYFMPTQLAFGHHDF